MKIKDFVISYYPYAKAVEDKTGLSAIAILSQAALESGWGERAPGNMFFGVKDTDGVNGNEQLLTTTEYLKNPDAKFPKVISKVFDPVKKLYKYIVKDYFRKYNTPEDSFNDHAVFFQKNKRYNQAWLVRNDYDRFFEEIARVGYATAPGYSDILKTIAKRIKENIV